MWSANPMPEETKYEPSLELTLCFHLWGVLVRLLLHDAQLLPAAEETPPNHQGPVKHGDRFGDTSKCFRVN